MVENISKDQCVYIITTYTGYWKIGISINPEARVFELQTGSPFKLHFHGGSLIGPQGFNARAVERQLHRRLAKYRVHGEWFQCSEAELMAVWSDVWETAKEIAPYAPYDYSMTP